ncbi:aspartate/glutamate racemase family protein [Cohnella rhizosphaerae]|uniref:Aspartate/glutamate racemase family protein n=1 Tax=Cohnella rhizosphaerae TaxID=1457232 RepID=A0A9X4KQJ2_9BACL|nr:aspartate/glutamate racemase family protein [Cohnella rhizosphaerae]MDG0809299.1 aspartate/glutamate racemase family protein [Cohnella rhizosphaerae]
MGLKIACLHAHESNIAYIARIRLPAEMSWAHYVDPGLIARMSADAAFTEDRARDHVVRQLEWMAMAGADAILITCTNYIALLDEARPTVRLPILKIDEPFFEELYGREGAQALLFTNPATVEGTMARLYAHAEREKRARPQIEAVVLSEAFDLVMRGEKEAYLNAVQGELDSLLDADPERFVAVAQLSMVDAAERAEAARGVRIGQPLRRLAEAVHALSRELGGR